MLFTFFYKILVYETEILEKQNHARIIENVDYEKLDEHLDKNKTNTEEEKEKENFVKVPQHKRKKKRAKKRRVRVVSHES